MSLQSDTQKPILQEDDEQRKRAVLAALVEAGDLPSNVLQAWDNGEDIIEADVVENEI